MKGFAGIKRLADISVKEHAMDCGVDNILFQVYSPSKGYKLLRPVKDSPLNISFKNNTKQSKTKQTKTNLNTFHFFFFLQIWISHIPKP